MDPYHAPYKPKHRYWPGLLLVLRFVLLIVFAFEFDPQQDTSINLLAILVGAGILHLWAWISGGVYKHWCLDALEGSFALNLIILVGATCYVKLTKGNQLAAGYTSISIAFATFLGILAYHIFLRLRDTKLCKKIFKLERPNIIQNVNDLNLQAGNNFVDDPRQNDDTDRLRESLLDDQPQVNYGAL